MGQLRKLLFLAVLLASVLAPVGAAYAGCPAGYERQGNRCVKYSCRPGCWYVGNGMCRCRR